MREFGFSASELDRAKKWMASFYERAYNERDKTESGSVRRRSTCGTSSNDEPAPGIEYEYKLVQQVLPGITVNEASAMAKALLVDNSRVVLAVSPQKPDIRIPTDAQLQAALQCRRDRDRVRHGSTPPRPVRWWRSPDRRRRHLAQRPSTTWA